MMAGVVPLPKPWGGSVSHPRVGGNQHENVGVVLVTGRAMHRHSERAYLSGGDTPSTPTVPAVPRRNIRRGSGRMLNEAWIGILRDRLIDLAEDPGPRRRHTDYTDDCMVMDYRKLWRTVLDTSGERSHERDQIVANVVTG